ncbi:MAG: hypothetical protein AB7H92_14005 [Microbacteriaceae bacterium]
MAGTATVSSWGRSVKVHQVAWTSDASGDCNAGVVYLDGELVRIVTVPGAGGSAPTDNYDITLLDEDGIDLTAAEMFGDRDTSTTEELVPSGRIVHHGPVTVTVANAGNAKTGVIKIYQR